MPPARWLGVSAVVWGIACACTAACHDYTTLLASRVFIGLAEQSVAPGLIALNSQWYHKTEQPVRLQYLYLGLGFGQILGGLVSYGFQGLAPGRAALAGWRVMFLVLGAATVLVGIGLLTVIPASPMAARWLSEREKTRWVRHLEANRTGVENYAFRPRQLLETLLDPQVWILALNIIASSMTAAVGTTYSTTLIGLLGFAPRQAALLNMPGGGVLILATLAAGWLSRYARWSRASVFSLLTVLALVGSCLLAFVPSPTPLAPTQNRQNLPALLAGLYMQDIVAPVLTIQYSWAAANVAGATKKAIVFSMVSGAFAAGNIIGLQTFQARDMGSGYRPAKIAIVGGQAGALVLTGCLTGYYFWQNRRRNARDAKREGSDGEGHRTRTSAWKGMSDREDPDFRYSY